MSRHQGTKSCSIGRKRKKHVVLQNKQAGGGDIKIYINRKALKKVKEIRYLGNFLDTIMMTHQQ